MLEDKVIGVTLAAVFLVVSVHCWILMRKTMLEPKDDPGTSMVKEFVCMVAGMFFGVAAALFVLGLYLLKLYVIGR